MERNLMRRVMAFLSVVLALIALSALSALSGCSSPGVGNADVVVCNDSPQVIYTVTLSTEMQSESVSAAQGVGLLERGDQCGFQLEEGSRAFTLELMDEHGDLLARCRGSYEGKRLLLTLEENGGVSVREEEA